MILCEIFIYYLIDFMFNVSKFTFKPSPLHNIFCVFKLVKKKSSSESNECFVFLYSYKVLLRHTQRLYFFFKVVNDTKLNFQLLINCKPFFIY